MPTKPRTVWHTVPHFDINLHITTFILERTLQQLDRTFSPSWILSISCKSYIYRLKFSQGINVLLIRHKLFYIAWHKEIITIIPFFCYKYLNCGGEFWYSNTINIQGQSSSCQYQNSYDQIPHQSPIVLKGVFYRLWRLILKLTLFYDLKVYLCIFVISVCQNSPELFQCEEHDSDTCSRECVLWFNIFFALNNKNNSQQMTKLFIAGANLKERI